ncbi:MAG: hypothetical protein GY952_06770 [Rhodobacteraceae bacterium]|nr:hypothetical protein [Paracoccaceae bacterium]
MEAIPVQFGGQSNPVGGAAGEARFVNCFLDVVGPEGKTQTIIQAHDGLIQKANQAGATGTRGVHAIDVANLLWVAGVQCFHVDAGLTVTSLGGVPGTGPVTFAQNRKKPDPQIMIVADGHRFIVEKASGNWTLSRIDDPDLPAPHSCAFLDGYFLAGIDDGRFFWSSIDEGTEWSALDLATAEGSPDKMRRLFVHDRVAMLFGEKTLETWANTGASTTFERTGFREIGCKARHSVAAVKDGIIWVAADDTVQFGRGLSYQEISRPRALKDLIEDADGEELRAWSYTKGGREFYALASDTWVWEYNTKTGFWNERESLIDGEISRWRGEHYAKWGSLHIFGDDTSTKLYALDEDTFGEAGTSHTITVQTPPQHTFPNGASFHRLDVDVVPGVGLNSSDAHEANPKLLMRWSDDGGHAWSNELSRSAGGIGEYGTEISYHRLGKTGPIGRTWRLQWSAPVARKIMQAMQHVTRLAG